MKRITTFIAIFLCSAIGVAQTKQSNQQALKDSVLNRIDSLVQITNAWLEQMVSGCFRTEQEADTFMNIHSVAETAKKNGNSKYKAILAVLEQ